MDLSFRTPAPPPDEVPQAHFRIASPYFTAAGIRVRRRQFTTQDIVSGQPVAVVSRALADRHWPGAGPKQLRLVAGTPPFEVVAPAHA